MFGIFEVFTDTIVICTLTALVILCSGFHDYGQAAGAELTILDLLLHTEAGYRSLPRCDVLFRIFNDYRMGTLRSRCIEFLFGKSYKPFMVLYALVAILAQRMDLGLMWSIAETFNGLMAIPNLIAVFLLSRVV